MPGLNHAVRCPFRPDCGDLNDSSSFRIRRRIMAKLAEQCSNTEYLDVADLDSAVTSTTTLHYCLTSLSVCSEECEISEIRAFYDVLRSFRNIPQVRHFCQLNYLNYGKNLNLQLTVNKRERSPCDTLSLSLFRIETMPFACSSSSQ